MQNLQAKVKKPVGDRSREEEETLWQSKVFLHCIRETGETAKVIHCFAG